MSCKQKKSIYRRALTGALTASGIWALYKVATYFVNSPAEQKVAGEGENVIKDKETNYYQNDDFPGIFGRHSISKEHWKHFENLDWESICLRAGAEDRNTDNLRLLEYIVTMTGGLRLSNGKYYVDPLRLLSFMDYDFIKENYPTFFDNIVKTIPKGNKLPGFAMFNEELDIQFKSVQGRDPSARELERERDSKEGT